MKTNAPHPDLGHHGPLQPSRLRRPLVAAAWVILILLATARPAPGQAPPAGDYGDAPDGPGALTHYPPMFHTTRPDARFPTEFNTANSRVGNPGAHHLIVGEEWFGPLTGGVSAEVGTHDPADPDGIANLAQAANNDAFDDGLTAVPFFLVLTSLPPAATITFQVSVAAGAPNVDRYVNILIDWDQDGEWRQNPVPGAAPEWAVQNHVVRVPPGTSKAITVPFSWGWNALLAPQVFWLRMTLSRTTIDPAAYAAVGGWDGSGTFGHGETEDYMFHPGVPLLVPRPAANPWTPPPQNLAGPAQPDIKLIPKSIVKAHGLPPAAMAVVQVPAVWPAPPAAPVAPVIRWWEVDWGQRGGFLFSPASPRMPPFGPPFSSGGTPPRSSAEIVPGGTIPGAIATIRVHSTVHPMIPPAESWPVNVRVSIPGILVKTLNGMIIIIHSGFGPFGLVGCFSSMQYTIEASSAGEPQRGQMLGLLANASTDFQSGNLQAAIDGLGVLAGILPTAPGLTEDEQLELSNNTVGVRENIILMRDTTGPVPVPVIMEPELCSHRSGMIPIDVTALYPDVIRADFFYHELTPEGQVIHLIGTDFDPTDGWRMEWETLGIHDGTYEISVLMTDSAGNEGEDRTRVFVDNTPPAPLPPLVPAEASGVVPVSVDFDPEEADTCVFEVSGDDGENWFEIGIDRDGETDGWNTSWDTSQLREGLYLVRARMTDAAGNTGESPVQPLVVQPSFAAWKALRGVGSGIEDLDQDGFSAMEEYYHGFNPDEFDPAGKAQYGLFSGPGGWHLGCVRRELVSGITVEVQASPTLGPDAVWSVIATNPPLSPAGVIEVPVTIDGPTGFFRLRFIEE